MPVLRVLVLGLGNDILTDDAVGLHVVRQIQSEGGVHPSVEIRETTEMGLALLDFMTGYGAVVIVDSIRTGRSEPGTIHELDADSLKQLTGRTPHFVGVSEVLALGRRLELAMPAQVKIFAIEIEDSLTLSTEMTPKLQGAVAAVVERVRAAVRDLLATCP